MTNEKHNYGFSKRTGTYLFLAKHLGLAIENIKNPGGSMNESDIPIEDRKRFKIFDKKHPFPDYGIRTNDGVKW